MCTCTSTYSGETCLLGEGDTNICGVHEAYMCVHMNDHKYLYLCVCIMCVGVCLRESLRGQVVF